MQSVTFECKVISPLFLGGANGDQPELRPPSLKGVMRYWWRAMHGHLSLTELREKEARIFGGTEVGGRSKILIQIPDARQVLDTRQAPLVPHKEWMTKEAIAPDTTFTVVLKLMPTKYKLYEHSELDLIEQLKRHFILTCLLGGLGKRVRRGMGSIAITKTQMDDGEMLSYRMPDSIENIADLIQSLAPKHFEMGKGSIFSRFGRGSRFPYIKEIYLGRPNSDVLTNISNTTHQLKTEYKQTYEASLGHAFRGRFSSPAFATVVGSANGLMPLITLLNTVPDKYHRQHVSRELQQEFIKSIL